MFVCISAWGIVVAALVRMFALIAAHLRAGLLPSPVSSSDVTVTIQFILPAPPGQGESSVVTSVVNPGARPVLVGLSVRRQRCPGWLGTGAGTRAVQWTTGRRYRADRQGTIGIVPPNGTTMVPVHFRMARGRYRVVAVIGQSDRRLRVVSMPLARRPEDGTWLSAVSLTDLFPWLI